MYLGTIKRQWVVAWTMCVILMPYSVTPEAYLRQIRRHANTSLQTSLFQGEHYRHLEIFLSHALRSERESSASESNEDGERFASFYRLDSDDQPSSPRNLPYPIFPPATPDHLQPDDTGVIFLRGYPCGQDLVELGAAYNIDPEFYRRHLCFLDAPLINNDVALLPSFQNAIFQLPVTTVCRHITPQYSSVQEKRRESTKQMSAYLKCLRHGGDGGRTWRQSESIVRSFAVHDLAEFSMQQMISIYVVQAGNPPASREGAWKGASYNQVVCVSH